MQRLNPYLLLAPDFGLDLELEEGGYSYRFLYTN